MNGMYFSRSVFSSQCSVCMIYSLLEVVLKCTLLLFIISYSLFSFSIYFFLQISIYLIYVNDLINLECVYICQCCIFLMTCLLYHYLTLIGFLLPYWLILCALLDINIATLSFFWIPVYGITPLNIVSKSLN